MVMKPIEDAPPPLCTVEGCPYNGKYCRVHKEPIKRRDYLKHIGYRNTKPIEINPANVYNENSQYKGD